MQPIATYLTPACCLLSFRKGYGTWILGYQIGVMDLRARNMPYGWGGGIFFSCKIIVRVKAFH